MCVCVCVCVCCRSKERIKLYFKIVRSSKRFVFILIHLFCFYVRFIYVYIAFVREYMWRKALLMECSMRLELTLFHSLNFFRLFVGFI